MKGGGMPRGVAVFLSCVLAVPTIYYIMYRPVTHDWRDWLPLLRMGALLGIAQLILRPLLRLVTAPLGCLTLGLSGTVIDVGLIYLCAHYTSGLTRAPELLYAVLTALAVNFVCAVVAKRR